MWVIGYTRVHRGRYISREDSSLEARKRTRTINREANVSHATRCDGNFFLRFFFAFFPFFHFRHSARRSDVVSDSRSRVAAFPKCREPQAKRRVEKSTGLELGAPSDTFSSTRKRREKKRGGKKGKRRKEKRKRKRKRVAGSCRRRTYLCDGARAGVLASVPRKKSYRTGWL